MIGPQTEREIKLVFEPGAKDELLRHCAFASATRAREPRLEVTTYFDTDDFALRNHGYALRIRKRNRRYVQTLKKVAADGHAIDARSEWEWKIPEHRLQFSPLGEILGADPRLNGEYRGAKPRFVTQVRRQTFDIPLDGAEIEAALDEGVVQAGDGDERISELELEVKNGSMAPAYRLALDLLEHNAMRLGVESKADRGFRLLTHESARSIKSRAAPLPPNATLGETLICTADAALRDFITNVSAAHDGNAEGIHQLRVALRRLRTALVFYAPCLERCARRQFSDAIRDLGLVFGAARDWDVFVEETLEAAKADGVREDWIKVFAEEAAARRDASHRAVRERLDSKAPAELVIGMQSWIRGREWAGLRVDAGSECIDQIMPELFDRLSRKVERRGRKVERLSPAELHPLRKSLKKLRYSSESASKLYGEKPVKRYAKRCKNLQSLLGAINDAQVTARLAQDIAPAHSAAWAPAAGALHEWNARRMKAACRKLPKAWRRLQQAPKFWH